MSPARAAVATTALGRIERWNQEMEAAVAYVGRIYHTPLLPDTHKIYEYDDRGRPLDGRDGRALALNERDTIATAAGVICTGAELGLDPMAALRSMYVIRGTPAFYALALRGLLQSQGHHFQTVEQTAAVARVRVRRADEDEWQEATWTSARARDMGLLPGRQNGPWQRNPSGMLLARATGDACRWAAADVILGVPYTVEELVDEATAVPLAIEPPKNGDEPGKRKTRRRVATASTPLPSAPPPQSPTVVPSDLPPEGTINQTERRQIFAGLKSIGIPSSQKQRVLDTIGAWLERDITSTDQIMAAELPTIMGKIRQRRQAQQQASQPENDDTPEEPPNDDDER